MLSFISLVNVPRKQRRLCDLQTLQCEMQNITPLHLAAKADALEVTELLLRHEAHRHATDQAVRLITNKQMR